MMASVVYLGHWKWIFLLHPLKISHPSTKKILSLMAFSNLYRQLQFIHFIVDIIFCVLQKQVIILIQKHCLNMIIFPNKQRVCNNPEPTLVITQWWGDSYPKWGGQMDNWTMDNWNWSPIFNRRGDEICVIGYWKLSSKKLFWLFEAMGWNCNPDVAILRRCNKKCERGGEMRKKFSISPFFICRKSAVSHLF